jgi:hypothetical protein
MLTVFQATPLTTTLKSSLSSYSGDLRPANFYQRTRRNAKLHTLTSHNGTRQVCLDYILVATLVYPIRPVVLCTALVSFGPTFVFGGPDKSLRRSSFTTGPS